MGSVSGVTRHPSATGPPAPRYWLAVASFLIGFPLAAGVSAQTQTPAPTITAVAVGEKALTVAWSAPDGVSESDITAYDVRHIESDAPDKADANWTLKEDAWLGYELRAYIFGLTDGQSYDVQVRAVTSNGDGAWSAPGAGTPTDGGGDRASAIPVTLQVPAVAYLSAGDSSDYFKIDLSSESTLLFFTNSSLADTVGELQSADGTPMDSNDDAFFQLLSGRRGELFGYEGFGSNFFMARKGLDAGDSRATAKLPRQPGTPAATCSRHTRTLVRSRIGPPTSTPARPEPRP